MEAVAFLFLALAAGVLAGRLVPRGRKPAARVLGLLVYPLVGLQGVGIGAHGEVVARLPVVALLAALIAAATLAASAVVAAFLTRRLRAAEPAGPAQMAGGSPWRSGLQVTAALGLGVALGALGLWPSAVDAGAWAWRLLLLLVGLVGFELGAGEDSLAFLLRQGRTLFVLPLAVVLGTGIAALVLWPWLGQAGVAAAAGCGWYSLAGPVVGSALGPEAGALAFLANLFREILAVLLIPVLVRARGPLPAVAAAGGTAMDTALPFLVRAAGPGAALPALFSGGVVSLVVPALLALACL